MHLLEHLDLHSFIHGQAHQRPHEGHCVGHAQGAEIVLASIFPPCWDEVLLLESLFLIAGKVDLPILKDLFLSKLGLGLSQHAYAVHLIVFELAEHFYHVFAGDLVLVIGGHCAQVLHHRVNTVGFLLFGWFDNLIVLIGWS